jgi:ribosome modulation factor
MKNRSQPLYSRTWNEGFEACLEGTRRSENPYKDGTYSSDEWDAGWMFMDDDLVTLNSK